MSVDYYYKKYYVRPSCSLEEPSTARQDTTQSYRHDPHLPSLAGNDAVRKADVVRARQSVKHQASSAKCRRAFAPWTGRDLSVDIGTHYTNTRDCHHHLQQQQSGCRLEHFRCLVEIMPPRLGSQEPIRSATLPSTGPPKVVPIHRHSFSGVCTRKGMAPTQACSTARLWWKDGKRGRRTTCLSP